MGWHCEGTLTVGLARLEVLDNRFLLCETVLDDLLDSSTLFSSPVFESLLKLKRKSGHHESYASFKTVGLIKQKNKCIRPQMTFQIYVDYNRVAIKHCLKLS